MFCKKKWSEFLTPSACILFQHCDMMSRFALIYVRTAIIWWFLARRNGFLYVAAYVATMFPMFISFSAFQVRFNWILIPISLQRKLTGSSWVQDCCFERHFLLVAWVQLSEFQREWGWGNWHKDNSSKWRQNEIKFKSANICVFFTVLHDEFFN